MATVLERGDLSVFYRPRVRSADALVAPPGVQALYLLLGCGDRHRRIRVGKNALPERPGERFWIVVERVGSFERAMGDQLAEERYVTKTRGERVQPAARFVARGEYEVVHHDDHAHLTYRVDLTEEDDAELHIPPAASFVLLVKSDHGPATWTTDGDVVRALDTEDEELVLVAAGDSDRVLE